jgi:hypothetical protein
LLEEPYKQASQAVSVKLKINDNWTPKAKNAIIHMHKTRNKVYLWGIPTKSIDSKNELLKDDISHIKPSAVFTQIDPMPFLNRYWPVGKEIALLGDNPELDIENTSLDILSELQFPLG